MQEPDKMRMRQGLRSFPLRDAGLGIRCIGRNQFDGGLVLGFTTISARKTLLDSVPPSQRRRANLPSIRRPARIGAGEVVLISDSIVPVIAGYAASFEERPAFPAHGARPATDCAAREYPVKRGRLDWAQRLERSRDFEPASHQLCASGRLDFRTSLACRAAIFVPRLRDRHRSRAYPQPRRAQEGTPAVSRLHLHLRLLCA